MQLPGRREPGTPSEGASSHASHATVAGRILDTAALCVAGVALAFIVPKPLLLFFSGHPVDAKTDRFRRQILK